MRKQLDLADEVYAFFRSFFAENGYAPSVREVCKACGIKSTATAFACINELARRGLIDKTDGKNRAVSLKQNVVNVPLIGTVAAGQPIFATQNYDGCYSIPKNFFTGDNLFMLNVQGDSMINIGILDGDKIVVRSQPTAENGDIVVALVDDSATVKRYFKRDGKFILHPENDDMQDFVFDEVTILGKVIGLLRNI